MTTRTKPKPNASNSKRRHRQQCVHIIKEIKAKAFQRPVENLTDQEIFAKITGASLTVAEDVLTVYEGNLARIAGSTAQQMQKITGIGKARSEKIVAAMELGKRLARFHAEKDKITAPSDVADLMMSKMRYLQKEIVCVLCLGYERRHNHQRRSGRSEQRFGVGQDVGGINRL